MNLNSREVPSESVKCTQQLQSQVFIFHTRAMEFLVDTGMELARCIIFKVFELCQDEASKRVAGRTGQALEGYVVRDWLQPQMDKLEEEIKDLAEGTYRTSLSHLHHTFVILRERYDTLDRSNSASPSSDPSSDLSNIASFPPRNDEQGLPEVAITLIDMAYDKAYNSFNYTSNLSSAKRITAMQVAVLCIGLHHVVEPRVLLARWEKCFSDVLRDPTILKCVEKYLEGSQGLFRFFYQWKAKDLDAFVWFARDLLRQISRIAARDELEKATIKNVIERIVWPREFKASILKVWAEKLNWLDYVNSCTFRMELRLKEAGAAFDACAALPDGGVVLALGNDALVQYNRDLERTNFKGGSYYSLTYDPFRKCLWGFSKRQNTLAKIEIATLNDDDVQLAAPVVSSNMRVSRWHISVTKSGWIVVAAQVLRESDAKGAKPYIFIRKSDDQTVDWTQVTYECNLRGFAGFKITDIAAEETGSSGEFTTIKIALALEGALYLLTAKVGGKGTFVTESKVVAAELTKDRTSCQFDTEGLLIAVVRRKCLFIYDCEKDMVIKQAPAMRSSGTWVAVGQRAAWVPTLHGDIYQYEYFVF